MIASFPNGTVVGAQDRAMQIIAEIEDFAHNSMQVRLGFFNLMVI